MKPGDLKSAKFAKSEDSELRAYSRFDLEDKLMGMYRIPEDLALALDDEERKAVIRMHLLRVDALMDVFEHLVAEGKLI